jgi:dynein heavy chain
LSRTPKPEVQGTLPPPTAQVKDFGKALARYVIVFNCSDGVDFKMTGKMFSGLAQTGTWACLDEVSGPRWLPAAQPLISVACVRPDGCCSVSICTLQFNRIEVEVLSVVATQIASVMTVSVAGARAGPSCVSPEDSPASRR